jgi:hypothetical protein
MQTADLKLNAFYAYRERRHPGVEILKVKLLAVVGRGGRIKIRFEDGPFPGLEDYAHTRQLVIPWGERKAFLRDEERQERIKVAERKGVDSAVSTAIEAVLEATGEPSLWLSGNGLAAPAEAVERLMRRAGVDGEPAELHPLGFVDRHGTVHLPTAGAEALARAFAAAEPESVTMYLEAEEAEDRARGYDPGDRFYHDYLRTQRPGFAVARQWAGFENELESLQKEIARLRGLVMRGVSELEAAGRERESWKLRRALDGR